MREVFAFAVSVRGLPGAQTINHRTAARARAAYLRDLQDVLPDLKFTDLAATKMGPPVTPPGFVRTATYRGMPSLQCGQRVRLRGEDKDARGVVVGHNDSANFEVLFDDDSPLFARLTLNVHPSELVLGVAQ